MAKTNYSFEKRQRDLAKKKKKEEKRQKKLNKGVDPEKSVAADEAGPITDAHSPAAPTPEE